MSMPCDNTHARTTQEHAHTEICKHTYTHQVLPEDRVNTSCLSTEQGYRGQSLHSLLFRCLERRSAGSPPPLHQIKHFQFSINFRPRWLHRRAKWYSQPHLRLPHFSQSGWWKETVGSSHSLYWNYWHWCRDDLVHPWRHIGVKRVLTFLPIFDAMQCLIWESVVANCSQSSLVSLVWCHWLVMQMHQSLCTICHGSVTVSTYLGNYR